MKKVNIAISILIVVAITTASFFILNSRNNSEKSVFEKKQECAKYTSLANKKISESGRVFEKDSFTLNEIFYSPKMDTCLYAYTIYTTFDPREIYSIDDLFGGSVYTGGLAANAEKSFFQKIEELKK
jgi:hypothetical protein